MAKILRKHLINTVKISYYKSTLLLTLCWAAVVFCVICAFFSYGVTLIFLIPLIFFTYRILHRSKALKSGVTGEKNCLKLLCSLPKGYFIIPDVTLRVKNKTAQLDYIVICPSGIFIIEAKNHGGVISGSLSKPRLYKTKYRNGKQQTTDFYNPVYQISTHIRLMRELLETHKIQCEIYGAVYFSNPSTVLEIDTFDDIIPVFSHKQNGEKQLLRYLLSIKQNRLSVNQVKKLKKFIFSHCS